MKVLNDVLKANKADGGAEVGFMSPGSFQQQNCVVSQNIVYSRDIDNVRVYHACIWVRSVRGRLTRPLVVPA